MDMVKLFPKWEETDIQCEHCHNIKTRTRGISRQNLIRLVKPRLTINEVAMTLILIGIIAIGLLYNVETKACREWLKPMQGNYTNCLVVCNSKCAVLNLEPTYQKDFNQTELLKING